MSHHSVSPSTHAHPKCNGRDLPVSVCTADPWSHHANQLRKMDTSGYVVLWSPDVFLGLSTVFLVFVVLLSWWFRWGRTCEFPATQMRRLSTIWHKLLQLVLSFLLFVEHIYIVCPIKADVDAPQLPPLLTHIWLMLLVLEFIISVVALLDWTSVVTFPIVTNAFFCFFFLVHFLTRVQVAGPGVDLVVVGVMILVSALLFYMPARNYVVVLDVVAKLHVTGNVDIANI